MPNQQKLPFFESQSPKEHEKDPTKTPISRTRTKNFSLGPRADSSRDEMNLAEFPLAVLSTRVDPSVKTLEFSDFVKKSNGELIERKWIITGADKFGLPTSTDDDVVLGLMRISMDQGFRDRKVYFTRYELLKTLRWKPEGRNYARLIKSLDRLSGVRIRSTNSFYDNKTKSYQTCNFGVIDAYEINDERSIRAGQEHIKDSRRSFFIWSEILFDSFKAGFVKKLDLDFYFSLKSSVGRRMYRFLDKHFYYKLTVEMPLMVFAFQKLGLSRNYKYVSSIKQQLEPAAKELVRLGFLASYSFSGRGENTLVRFTAGKGGKTLPVASVTPKEETTEKSLVRRRGVPELLASRGISAAQIETILRGKNDHDMRKIRQVVGYFDELVRANDKKISKNPVGFLYRAVQHLEGFNVPESFLSDKQGHEKKGTQRNTSERPELRLFKPSASGGSRSPSQQPDALETDRSEYAKLCDVVIAKALKKMDLESIQEMRSSIESKMVFLKGVLDDSRFEEAIEGCVKEELLKREGMPSFERWAAGRKGAKNS